MSKFISTPYWQGCWPLHTQRSWAWYIEVALPTRPATAPHTYTEELNADSLILDGSKFIVILAAFGLQYPLLSCSVTHPHHCLCTMKTWYYLPQRNGLCSTQGVKYPANHPKLTKEAHQALQERRRNSRNTYCSSLNNALSKINELTGEMAITHHKSLQRIEEDLYMRSHLSQKRQQRTNSWNAWVWYMSQKKKNHGMYTPMHLHSPYTESQTIEAQGSAVLPTISINKPSEYNQLSNEEH